MSGRGRSRSALGTIGGGQSSGGDSNTLASRAQSMANPNGMVLLRYAEFDSTSNKCRRGSGPVMGLSPSA